MLTPGQILAGTKTVTRRIGWRWLKEGELLRPVRQCQGLKRGEKMQVLRGPLLVRSVRREALTEMLANPAYGAVECGLEGFPDLSPRQFVEMFCASHKGCTPQSVLTRIEFCYTD